jgi:predicted permease
MRRRKQMLDDLNQDIQDHIEQEIEDNVGRGMSPEEARCAAFRKFGNVTRVKEETREVWTIVWMEQFMQDLRFALRLLRKSPGFALTAVLTLSLAIGANAVVFAALNAVIIRPLNVPRTESLYSIHRLSDNSANQSYLNYLDLRDRNRSFEDLAGYNFIQAGLDTGKNPSSSWLIAATGNYFDVLEIRPYLGRFFHVSDEKGPNSAPYLVLTHGFWQSRFHSDPGVVGRVVQVNKHPFTIIGVAPQGFVGTLLFGSPDGFVPIVNQEQIEGRNVLDTRANRWMFMTMGHLKPGVTPEQAAADVNSISAYLEKNYPNDHRHKTLGLARPSLYGEYMGRPVRTFLTALMMLAGLILLAACANLGSLFAARAADRAREVALRLALGASRTRIVRQLLTEAILISVLGGAIGLWGGVILLRWLRAWQPFPQFPISIPVSPDANVYAVAVLLSLASGLLFGVIPVKQALQTDPYETIKSGARCTSGRRVTGRDLLVLAQISICAVLITSSMVAVRGLVRSMNSDFGFEPRNAILVGTDLRMAAYRADAMPAMQKSMIQAMETIPGVTSVGLVDGPPLSNGGTNTAIIFTDDTADLRPANSAATPAMFKVSPEYLTAASTALLAGRNLTWHDDKNAPQVAVINQEFARKIFGSVENAIGHYFKMRDGARTQVVGIVENGKYESLTEEQKPAVFLSILQSGSSDTTLVLRSSRDPQQLASEIRNKLRELDPGLPSFIQTWSQGLDLVLFAPRVATVSLGILGLIGAMLSLTGVFGLAAYAVSNRMKELGIRIALGAPQTEVLRAALGRAFKLLAFGSAAGLIMGILATKVLAYIVYQATPRDPLVLTGVVLLMLTVGLLATWIPAQRALSIDPLILLREE